ncbi:hypothetical protein FRC04_003182 [Tulasnella sp. 424]|nr:hypothetical protein FRC04_003182 [Tulasnella sp. 424]
MEDLAVTLTKASAHVGWFRTIDEVQTSEQGSDRVHESSVRLNGFSYPDPSFSTSDNNGRDVPEISGTLSVDNETPVYTGGFADVCKGTWTTPDVLGLD